MPILARKHQQNEKWMPESTQRSELEKRPVQSATQPGKSNLTKPSRATKSKAKQNKAKQPTDSIAPPFQERVSRCAVASP